MQAKFTCSRLYVEIALLWLNFHKQNFSAVDYVDPNLTESVELSFAVKCQVANKYSVNALENTLEIVTRFFFVYRSPGIETNVSNFSISKIQSLLKSFPLLILCSKEAAHPNNFYEGLSNSHRINFSSVEGLYNPYDLARPSY